MRKLLFALFFLTIPLAAAPAVTSISQTSGSVAGGNTVIVRGSGFESCPVCSPPVPTVVRFGEVYGTTLVQTSDSLTVVVPPHLPGTVNVTVEQWNGKATLPNGYTYSGQASEGFHRVLLPLFTAPVNGAFGSRFVTTLRIASTDFQRSTSVYGLIPKCNLATCIYPDPLQVPYVLDPARPESDFLNNGKPGLFLLIPKSDPDIQANLRVYDETRDAMNFGTELPVVHEEDFTLDPILLLGVPADPRFRNTLRVYATGPTTVTVTMEDLAWHLPLRAGENELDPAYAQFSGFPVGQGLFDVKITPSTTVPPVPGMTAPKVWAFISVTNNDTQMITTISPQR